MDTLPPEILLLIVEHLTNEYKYDEIINLYKTNKYYNALIKAEKEKVFTGIRWLAWLYTKPFYINLFSQQLQQHYELPIKTIISVEQFHIPDIRNNLRYTSNNAIDQFLKLRIMIRSLLKQPIPDIVQDIDVFNKELDFLCDITIQFMKCILDIIVLIFNKKHNKSLDPQWSANIQLIENINIVRNAERFKFIAFFNCLNRLNTIICHTLKLLVFVNES